MIVVFDMSSIESRVVRVQLLLDPNIPNERTVGLEDLPDATLVESSSFGRACNLIRDQVDARTVQAHPKGKLDDLRVVRDGVSHR